MPAHHLVGDEDVPDPGFGHHLGLAELRAGDAESTRLELHVRDLGDLLPFRVGPPPHAVAAEERGHLGDVALHQVEIDEQGRRVEMLFQHDGAWPIFLPSGAG